MRRVLEGGIYVSESVGNSMIEKFAAGGAYTPTNPIDGLSNRELQVLHMIGKGLSTRQTAEALNLGLKTVESHRQRIKRKLSLQTSAQLMQYAVNWYAGRAPDNLSGDSGLVELIVSSRLLFTMMTGSSCYLLFSTRYFLAAYSLPRCSSGSGGDAI